MAENKVTNEIYDSVIEYVNQYVNRRTHPRFGGDTLASMRSDLSNVPEIFIYDVLILRNLRSRDKYRFDEYKEKFLEKTNEFIKKQQENDKTVLEDRQQAGAEVEPETRSSETTAETYLAGEVFKEHLAELREFYGEKEYQAFRAGDIDITQTTDSILFDIAQKLENTPDNAAELQNLAIKVAETYYANTGEDVSNLPTQIQDKLKTILGENAKVDSKYPELADKIAEITKPEPVKEPEIISLEANAEKHQEYQSLTGNEARRQFVMSEFKDGKFSDASHIDFFLEQYGKGEILVYDADKTKLKALLAGIDGYNGVENKAQNLADNLIKSSLQTQVSIASGTMVTPDMLKPIDLDLGLSDTLKNIEKADGKDTFAKLISEANQEAIRRRYEGNNPDSHGNPFGEFSEITKTLKQKQEEAKWYQYGKKRQIRKALKGLMEEGYWEEKVNLNSTKTSLGWNDFRKYLAGDRTKSFEQTKEKLDNVLELRTQDASMRWMSANGWKKLKIKTALLFKKSPEKLTQKLLKNADKAKIADLTEELTTRLQNMPQPTTKLETRATDSLKKLLDGTIKTIGEYPKVLDKQKSEALKALDVNTALKSNQEKQKFQTKLNEHTAKLREEMKKSLAKDPTYMAYVKLHGEKAAAEKFNVEKMITADKVMEQIFNAQAKDGKLNGKTLEELKKALGMDKDEQQTDKPVTNESEDTRDTEDTQEKTNPVKLGREITLDSERNPVEGYPSSKEAQLMVSPDGSRYDFITKDSDGKPREPSKEEIDKMVESLKDKNLRITLEDSFSGQTQLAILEAMEKAGIEVTDKEQTKERAQKRKEKEEEEKKKKEDERGEHDGKPKPTHEGDGTTPKPEQTQEGDKPTPAPEQTQEEKPAQESEKPTPEPAPVQDEKPAEPRYTEETSRQDTDGKPTISDKDFSKAFQLGRTEFKDDKECQNAIRQLPKELRADAMALQQLTRLSKDSKLNEVQLSAISTEIGRISGRLKSRQVASTKERSAAGRIVRTINKQMTSGGTSR